MKLTKETIERLRYMRNMGADYATIKSTLGVSNSTISRYTLHETGDAPQIIKVVKHPNRKKPIHQRIREVREFFAPTHKLIWVNNDDVKYYVEAGFEIINANNPLILKNKTYLRLDKNQNFSDLIAKAKALKEEDTIVLDKKITYKEKDKLKLLCAAIEDLETACAIMKERLLDID